MNSESDEVLTQTFRFFVAYWRSSRTLRGHLEPLLEERFGLELKDYLVLGSIYRGCHYPTELADLLGMPKDMTSRIIQKLLRKSLIVRSIDEQDSRKTLLVINTKGTEIRNQIRESIQNTIQPVLEQLGHEQTETLIQTLTNLADLIPPYCKYESPGESRASKL